MTTLILTPNNRQYSAKDNSWYDLHIMTKEMSERLNSLNPKSYTREDGSKRYKVKLPVLLSITSTEKNEILMDISDVFRCFNIPYSRHLRIQMYVEGKEVQSPGCNDMSNATKFKTRDNSWYVLHVNKDYADYYEKLDPEECCLDDGRVGYRVNLPMLINSAGAGKEKLMDIDDICKHFNVPNYLHERLLMYVDGVEVEHPSNKITKRIHTLPIGAYYVGDPAAVLSNVKDFFEKFLGGHERDELFNYRGRKILSIKTGRDGSYRLYENKKKISSDQTIDSPVHIDNLLVDLATISFIPLGLLKSAGMSSEKIEKEGYTFEAKSCTGKPEGKVFDVTIYEKGGFMQYVKFLSYIILIDDKTRCFDEEL